MRKIGLIMLNLRTHDLDPSARVTVEVEGCDKNVVNKLKLSVMWSVDRESMTQFEEDDIRHVSSLPNSVCAMVGVEAGFHNLIYSSTERTTNCSKVLLADAM